MFFFGIARDKVRSTLFVENRINILLFIRATELHVKCDSTSE